MAPNSTDRCSATCGASGRRLLSRIASRADLRGAGREGSLWHVADDGRIWRGREVPTDEAIDDFKQAVLAKLTLAVGKDAASATGRDWFVATTLALRDRVIYRWLE